MSDSESPKHPETADSDIPVPSTKRRVRFALEHTSSRFLVALGYLSYMLIGWALLASPWAANEATAAIDHLFIAVSAVSTTGLSTVDVGAHYTLFGQLIILCLIQLGGLGYMSFSSYVLLSRSDELSPWRKNIAKEAFSLPERVKVGAFVRAVAIFTLLVELLGAVSLGALFSARGMENPFWLGLFHSVSAFCTAGFSLFSDGMQGFRDDTSVLFVLSILSYLGAIGFLVLVDVWLNIVGPRRFLSFTSKVILRFSLWILALGTLLVALTDSSLATRAPSERLLDALFQVMSAATTVGFSSVPVGGLAASSLLLIIVFMTIGASPSGTGGGLKVTTLGTLFGVMRSTLKRRGEARLWKRPIETATQRVATSAALYVLIAFCVATFLLLTLHEVEFMPAAFEVASALGTVGLSMGFTAQVGTLGKLILIVLMFAGRVGILSFGILASWHDETPAEEQDKELVL